MEQRLIATVAGVLQVPPSTLSLETEASDVEAWDSLAHINIVSEIEAEFGVAISIEQVAEIRKIRDFLAYVGNKP